MDVERADRFLVGQRPHRGRTQSLCGRRLTICVLVGNMLLLLLLLLVSWRRRWCRKRHGDELVADVHRLASRLGGRGVRSGIGTRRLGRTRSLVAVAVAVATVLLRLFALGCRSAAAAAAAAVVVVLVVASSGRGCERAHRLGAAQSTAGHSVAVATCR